MMTSLGHRGGDRLIEETGIMAFLTKPVKQSQLFAQLAMIIGGDAIEPDGSLGADTGMQLSQPGTTFSSTSAKIVKEGGNPVRILVAEDNIVNQKVILHQLQKLGYAADAVANGGEVLHSLEWLPYDIVLRDG
jgi:two-component system sensor histidine kinase/response regulator